VHGDDLLAGQEPPGVGAGLGRRHPDAVGDFLDRADALGRGGDRNEQDKSRKQASQGTFHQDEPLFVRVSQARVNTPGGRRIPSDLARTARANASKMRLDGPSVRRFSGCHWTASSQGSFDSNASTSPSGATAATTTPGASFSTAW